MPTGVRPDMATTLSVGVRALIDGPNFATVATLDPDGGPQTSIVWVGLDHEARLQGVEVAQRGHGQRRLAVRVPAFESRPVSSAGRAVDHVSLGHRGRNRQPLKRLSYTAFRRASDSGEPLG
jgi:hypothetical protein